MPRRSFPHLRRLLRLTPRPELEADDEIAFHLDTRAQELIARGMSPDDAHRSALAAFGDVETVRHQLPALNREEPRRTTIRDGVDGILQDVRYALRTLTREPQLVAGVVTTLALAVGANAAMFGIVRQLML